MGSGSVRLVSNLAPRGGAFSVGEPIGQGLSLMLEAGGSARRRLSLCRAGAPQIQIRRIAPEAAEARQSAVRSGAKAAGKERVAGCQGMRPFTDAGSISLLLCAMEDQDHPVRSAGCRPLTSGMSRQRRTPAVLPDTPGSRRGLPNPQARMRRSPFQGGSPALEPGRRW